MSINIEEKKQVVIKFAGDSGDGMQLTGGQFTNNTALLGNDLSTFPDFPAEIRAPQGTVAGVSGFQIHFGSNNIFTPGDTFDVLVAMNAASLKANIGQLRNGGIIIANKDGFDKKNLRLAEYEDGYNPLDEGNLDQFKVYEVDVTTLTRESLKETDLGKKDIDRSKNMFVLGLLYWLFGRSLDSSIDFLTSKFKKKPAILESNIKVLKAGYYFGDTAEFFTTRYEVKPAKLTKGTYRGIQGNEATAIGLTAAVKNAGIDLFLGSYPITPATDILHELAKQKKFGVKIFQAEDEIAAICASIGASFAGNLGLTTSSGPGIALKGEAMGLATILEIPLVIVNVQRGGPSTGLPTKTEQSDLMQAMYARNGEAQLPVIAAKTPSDCFFAAYEACRIALEHMTPVILLTDGYIANGSEPWKFPKFADLPKITYSHAKATKNTEGDFDAFFPYDRDEKGVRPWAIPGTEGLQHRIGGLEKQERTGNVSYDPENHERMVKARANKIAKIADYIPEQKIDNGPDKGTIIILGWGSTYGAIKTAVKDLLDEGHSVAHAQLTYIHPFPRNLGDILSNFEHILIPEINDGQLDILVRNKFLLPTHRYNKVKGLPIAKDEIKEKVYELLKK